MQADDEEILRGVAKYEIQINKETHAIKLYMQLQVDGIKTKLQTEIHTIPLDILCRVDKVSQSVLLLRHQ